MAGRWVAAAMPFALGGCLLVLSDKLDGLDDGSPDAAPGDGATSEASSSSGAAVEAGTSSGGDAGPPVPFCSTQPGVLLCDDFDDPTKPLVGFWPDDNFENGAAITVTTDKARSASSSALAVTQTVPKADLDPGGSRMRVVDWPDAKTSLMLGMSIFIDSVPTQPAASANFASLFLDVTGYDSIGTRLYFEPQGSPDSVTCRIQSVVYPAGQPGQFDGIKIVVPLHTWTRIERKLTLGSSPKETITVDGVPFIYQLPAGFTYAGGATVGLGFQYTSGPGDGYRFYIDDVVFDAK